MKRWRLQKHACVPIKVLMVSSLEKKNLRKKIAMIIVIIMFGNLVRISTFLVVMHLIKCIAEMSTYEENPSGGIFLMIY